MCLGQSEVDIDAVVDMLIIIVPPGGGDSLQASKKGQNYDTNYHAIRYLHLSFIVYVISLVYSVV